MTVPILDVEQRWECPSCDFTDVTHVAGHISHLHICRGQKLLMVPMVPAGTKTVHVVRLAEDYVGGRHVQTDAEGRPVTHVNTVHDDGMDATVYPASAFVSTER